MTSKATLGDTFVGNPMISMTGTVVMLWGRL